jgi:hypothetical protein
MFLQLQRFQLSKKLEPLLEQGNAVLSSRMKSEPLYDGIETFLG